MPLYQKILIGAGVSLGSILLFFILLFVGISIYTSGLKTPIEKQLVSIRAEDYAVAYSYTTVNFQKTTSLEQFKQFINTYSGLRNNESISYDSKSIDNHIGTVKAQLKSRSGSETPVLYRLIKEHDQWRIETMIINPDQNAPSASNNVTKSTESPKNNIALNNLYQDPKYKYQINYLSDWSLSKENNGLVMFRGKENTASAQSSFLVQAFKQSRKQNSVQQFVDSAKNMIAKNATDMKIIEEGTMPPLNPDSKYEGRYAIYSYKIDNHPIGHLEVVAYSGSTRFMYVLDYIAPASQFENDLPIAKAMIISFAVKR